MHLIVILLVLAILGIIDAGYLAWRHYQKKPLICPVNHDCNVVVESEWATMFGIRNEVLGLLFYVLLGVGGLCTVFIAEYRSLIEQGLLIISIMAALYSLFLLYIQRYIIKDYCFYCIISALINFLIVANVFALVLQ